MRVIQRAAAYVLAGVLALSVSAALAQAGGARRGAQQGIPQQWLVRLGLNEDQQQKVKAATEVLQADLKAAQALTAMKEKRQATTAANKKYEVAVESVLNDEQKKQLAAMRTEAKEFQAMGPLGNQMVGLNLSDEQKAKIKEITAKYQPELEKLRADQRNAADKKPIQEQLRAVNMKIQTEVRATLTPDQQKKLGGARRKNQ